jgi:hypothetical protein
MTNVQREARERVLDPVERLSEILFGLIMVLTFTCSISAGTSGHEEVREMVIGAIGCNLAWGLIDAVMYLMAILMERGRGLAVVRAVRAGSDAQAGRDLVARVLPEPLDELFDEPALERARAQIVALPDLPRRPSLRGRDWAGALGVFLLVFLSTLPVVVPFVIIEPMQRSIRISNAVAIVMLYFVGHGLGAYSGLRPLRTGFAMVAIGLVLVGITIALGG